MKCLITVLLLTEILAVFGAFEKNNNEYASFINGRPYHGFVPSPTISEEDMSTIQAKTFKQTLDHFNSSITVKWNQRYFINTKYYVKGGPIFLIVGGESPDLGKWTVGRDLQYVRYANSSNALIFALEHRFYGESRPFQEQTIENLAYLNSRQAVEDVAKFIRAMNAEHNLFDEKWILFGASYGGSLANWVYKKHPELVAGVMLSSAFSTVQLDFQEYLYQIGRSLFLEYYRSDYDDECSKALFKVFTLMSDYMYNAEGRKILTDTFLVQPRLDSDISFVGYKEMQMFFATIIASLEGIVQYNGLNVQPYSTDALNPQLACKIIVDTQNSTLNNLANVYRQIMLMYTGKELRGINVNYNGLVNYLKTTNYEDSQTAASRSWFWQQCSEFGLLITTDNGETPFKSTLPSNFYLDLCADVFDKKFDVSTIAKAVEETEQYYPNANIAYPAICGYGGIYYDAWQELMPFTIPNYKLCSGNCHVADIYAAKANETSCLIEVRKMIEKCVRAIVTGEALPNPFSFITSNDKFSQKTKTEASREQSPLINSNSHSRLPSFLMGRPTRDGFVPLAKGHSKKIATESLVRRNFTQKQSHLDLNNDNYFKQRYWHNTQYYQEGGPHFLFLAGESFANEYWVTEEVQIMRSAKAYNASVYMLEHRYYGLSWPTEDQRTFYLKQFLNVEEALEDIAYFIQTMNEENNYTDPKWITFGGSYAGVLSAWFRENYPHLSVGAIATSAPLKIKADFYEYIMVVERSIKSSSRGSECYSSMREGFEQIFEPVQTAEGRVILSDIFALNSRWTELSKPSELDTQYFIQNVFGYFEGAIQYNNDNRNKYAMPGGSIEDFCGIINNSTELEYVRVANAMKALATHFDGQFTTLPNNYTDMVNELRNVEFSETSASRTWFFQTCYQFGYYQSSDIGDNIMSSARPINFFINLCNDVFSDLSYEHYIYPAVRRTQMKYLKNGHYEGTNVVFINGKIDPWSALGEYYEKDTIEIPTAHCADMYVPRDSDPKELKDARLLIDAAIETWLSGRKTSTESPTIQTASTTNPLNPSSITVVDTKTTSAQSWHTTSAASMFDKSSSTLTLWCSGFLFVLFHRS